MTVQKLFHWSDALIIFEGVYTLIKQVMGWNTKLNKKILCMENSYVLIIAHFKDNQGLNLHERWVQSSRPRVLNEVIKVCAALNQYMYKFKLQKCIITKFKFCWLPLGHMHTISPHPCVINRVIIYDFTIYSMYVWKFKPVFHCFSDILPVKFHIGALKNLVQSDKIQ